MTEMKIVVLLKFFRGELNPFDGAALECALEWGADVTAVSMAPPSAKDALENLTRLGVRAVLITDPLFAGSDTLSTGYILAEAIKRLEPDLVFAGRQSIDGDTGQVPPMLSERLGREIIPGVIEFDGGRIQTRSGAEASLPRGAIVTFERIRNLRFPSIFSKKGEVEVWDNTTLRLDGDKCGIKGSPTRVLRSYESTVGRRSCTFSDAGSFDALIKKALSKKTEKTAEDATLKTDEIYYVGDIKKVAERYAERAIPLDASGKTPEMFSRELRSLGARVVLFESVEKLRILAAKTAVLTGAGLCADCVSFRRENGSFIMTRPALGGNVTADIVSDAEMAFATVRPEGKRDGEIVFAIGKGAVPYLPEIRSLAEKYGATLAATRSVVDAGIMPYETQVGLTGKTVAPKVYVALGISGAVQHTSAIAGAGTVIAVNTDKDARIFDYSDYGIADDIKNLFKE